MVTRSEVLGKSGILKVVGFEFGSRSRIPGEFEIVGFAGQGKWVSEKIVM